MLYIASLAELRNELGIPDNQDDANLLGLAERIQGAFDAHCNRRFLHADAETELFDGGDFSLWVERAPIDAIATIHVSGDQEWDVDNLLDASDGDYRADLRRGRIQFGTSGDERWPAGRQNIRVVYSGGVIKSDGTAGSAQVDQTDVWALKRAFSLQLAYEWRNRQVMGLQSVGSQGVTITGAPAKLLPEVDLLLGKLKRL
jgi:hypothetical protein